MIDLWSWRNLAAHLPLSSVTASATMAEMVAAHQLLLGEEETLVGRTELTFREWVQARSRAAELWLERPRRNDNPRMQPVSPFQTLSSTAEEWPPGVLERLRQAVVSSTDVKSAISTARRPGSFLDAVLEMDHWRRHGDHFAPEVAALIASMATDHEPSSAYCAYSWSAPTAMILGRQGCRVTLELTASDEASFWSAVAVGMAVDVEVVHGNPAEHLATGEFRQVWDASVVCPPHGSKESGRIFWSYKPPPPHSDAWGVALADHVSRSKSVCVLLNSFLFRSSMADQAFKERAVTEFGLEAVVALPPSAAMRSSGLAANLLVLSKGGADDKVLMVDANDADRRRGALTLGERQGVERLVRRRETGEKSRLVSRDELAANDFNLLPDRYVLSREAARVADLLANTPTVLLGDLVEIYRPQPTPQSAEASPQAEFIDGPRELVVSDLSEVGLADNPSKRLQWSQVDTQRVRRSELNPGDVLLVIKGSAGKVGFVRRIPDGEVWVANQSFAILRLRSIGPVQRPEVLFRYLTSPLGQSVLQTLKVGAVIPSIQMADIRRLPIMVPNGATQARVAHEVHQLFAIEDEINELRVRQRERQAEIWPETLA
jgi:type I restriction-modification system DNA methylase subunit